MECVSCDVRTESLMKHKIYHGMKEGIEIKQKITTK
jgi:hypothetical protein